MKTFALIVALLIASPVFAVPPSVKLPAEVKGLPGAWLVIPAEVEGGKPRWRFPDAGLEEVRLDVLFPPDVLDKAKGKVVKADKPGRYRLESWNAAGDVASDIAVCVVVVGNPPVVTLPTDPPVKPDPTVPPTDKATAATYVYEKDDTAIPSGVMKALNALNRGERLVFDASGMVREWDPKIDKLHEKILATLFEQDATDGTGDVPEQYKVSLPAARQAGLPALVVSAGDKVLRVVKAPTTARAVMEAVP